MQYFNHSLIRLLSVVFVCGTVGLGLPLSSNAQQDNERDERKAQLEKEREERSKARTDEIRKTVTDFLEERYPLCGRGTQGMRFVVERLRVSVCDNKTGLRWQLAPSTNLFSWENAIRHCENLTHGGQTWRLPEANELWTLVDLSQPSQAHALGNAFGDPVIGPFGLVLAQGYWSATEQARNTPDPRAWVVSFSAGDVNTGLRRTLNNAWCVRVEQDAQ